MFKFIRDSFILSVLLIFALSACNLPSGTPITDEPNAIFTQAALTVQAQLTQVTPSIPFNTPTLPPPQPTNTAVTLPTLAPVATSTPVPPPTLACDQAQFIKDVTIPDGTSFAPGETFTKTWRLKNTGTCTWSGYSLVFDSGDAMNGTSSTAIPTVSSGQEVDLSVNLTAPATNGSYRGYWRIRNASGVLIPVLGGHQSKSFFVDIKVGVVSAGYDFYTRASSAIWISSAGITLTFGGPDSDTNGFAMYKDSQKLEDGSTVSKVLETHPQFVNDGVISGRFPVYTVVAGEHFTAKIGFLALSNGSCGTGNVKFQLNYKEGGAITPLGEWTKSCDGALKSIDVDLTSIKGKSVEFILAVLANGSSAQDWAVWVRPQIALP